MRLGIEMDRLRGRDKKHLLALAGFEGRQEVSRREVGEGLTLVGTYVTDEVFTFTGDDIFPGGTTFNVRKIKNGIANGQLDCAVLKVEITEQLYNYTLAERGVEEPRVAALRPEDLGKIGVAILMPGESLMAIDGNHRMVRRFREGFRDMRFAVVDFRNLRDRRFMMPATEASRKIVAEGQSNSAKGSVPCSERQTT